jgi:hypothetical protein
VSSGGTDGLLDMLRTSKGIQTAKYSHLPGRTVNANQAQSYILH